MADSHNGASYAKNIKSYDSAALNAESNSCTALNESMNITDLIKINVAFVIDKAN